MVRVTELSKQLALELSHARATHCKATRIYFASPPSQRFSTQHGCSKSTLCILVSVIEYGKITVQCKQPIAQCASISIKFGWFVSLQIPTLWYMGHYSSRLLQLKLLRRLLPGLSLRCHCLVCISSCAQLCWQWLHWVWQRFNLLRLLFQSSALSSNLILLLCIIPCSTSKFLKQCLLLITQRSRRQSYL